MNRSSRIYFQIIKIINNNNIYSEFNLKEISNENFGLNSYNFYNINNNLNKFSKINEKFNSISLKRFDGKRVFNKTRVKCFQTYSFLFIVIQLYNNLFKTKRSMTLFRHKINSRNESKNSEIL